VPRLPALTQARSGSPLNFLQSSRYGACAVLESVCAQHRQDPKGITCTKSVNLQIAPDFAQRHGMVRRFQAWIWPWKSSKRYVSFAVGCLDECSGLLVAVIVAHNSICSTVVQQKAKQLPSVHQFSCYNFKPFDLNTVITLLRRPTSHCVSQKEVLLRKSGHYWIWPALALTSVDNGKGMTCTFARTFQ
jgi:hypothetical protein